MSCPIGRLGKQTLQPLYQVWPWSCRWLLIEVAPLVSGCCTLLGRWTDITGPHPSLNLSRAGSKHHTLGTRLSRRAKPREVVMLTRHHWTKNLHDAGYRPRRMKFPSGTQRLRVQDQGEPPRWRTWAVVWHEEGWAPPCDIAQDTPHEWNAKIGENASKNWKGTCGQYCNPYTNVRGLRLPEFASYNNLKVANTFGRSG